ncbi:MAG: alanine--tRNA ligase [Patescibacteria group bacterium]
MNSKELRQKYLDFFKSKGHTVIPSASLIPENDPTVLFTTAGMHPLVPYLMGEKHPDGTRLTSVQKCIRTGDIDEVGDKTHLTFFEMLGNWSLGDYGKKEAIEFSFEFLTKELGFPVERLAVSVFAGDDDAPFDGEAFEVWKNLGIAESRIAKLPKKNNWWGPAGQTGPCGPDSEMFYWTGDPNHIPERFDDDNDLWVEIWNDVFMIYNKNADGKYEELKQKNVDTGMGLERTTAILNGFDDVYRCDHIWPIIQKIENISGKKYGESEEITKSMRIVADHLRAATMIMGDSLGIAPSNTDQGYVVRRLIRNAIRHGRLIEIKDNFSIQIGQVVIDQMSEQYTELAKNHEFVLKNLEDEEIKFKKTLEKGLVEAYKIFNKYTEDKNITGMRGYDFKNGELPPVANPVISGEDAFYLFQTYGFPIEMIKEMAEKRNMVVHVGGFIEYMKHHQDLSRTASAGMFKGGLADDSENTKKLHTAAHLMLSAMRQVLGNHVEQRGSNITPERLRFDFSHAEKMTPEQIKEVERLVNEQIEKKTPIVCEELDLEQARQSGAMGIFDNKYGNKVKVYTIGETSKEICGGPHADNTGDLGHFEIIKEESSSSGVRRIKAILK